MKTNTKNVANHGFTLIEMVGVLAVIAILAALLVPKIFAAINDSRISSAVSSVNACKTATMTYFGKTAAFPETNSFDGVLVGEKLMDQLLNCKIAETSSAAAVVPIAITAVGSLDGKGTGFSLDGTTCITGVKVVYVKLAGVTASDAKELSRRIDGDDVTLTPADENAADFLGRVTHEATSTGTTDVYIYLAHK